jgi:hypothetical protein
MCMLFACVLSATVTLAQPVSSPSPAPEAKPVIQPAKPAFPESWRGHWKGKSVAAAPGRDGMTFGTELVVQPTDDPGKWTWTLIYDGAAGRQERKYHLVAANADSAKNGRWKIDENNGIVLDASFINDALYCRFEVQGNDISVSYRASGLGDDRRLMMELVTTRTPGTETGGKDQTPVVSTFVPVSVQRAEMRCEPVKAE